MHVKNVFVEKISVTTGGAHWLLINVYWLTEPVHQWALMKPMELDDATEQH